MTPFLDPRFPFLSSLALSSGDVDVEAVGRSATIPAPGSILCTSTVSTHGAAPHPEFRSAGK